MSTLVASIKEALRTNGDSTHSPSGQGLDPEQLQAQIDKLQHELTVNKGIRQYLEHSSSIHHDQFRHAINRPGGAPSPEQFGALPGRSTTARQHDPRIGQPKRILVVGGGPAGLIALHELLNPLNRPAGQTLDEYHIQLYERRPDVGGVWYFEPDNDIAKGWHHGADGLHDDGTAAVNGNGHGTTPNGNGAAVNGNSKAVNGTDKQGFCYRKAPVVPRWPSPAYEGLVGNVLPPLLEFTSHPFGNPGQGLFPSMVETHEYLLRVAAPLRKYIKTSHHVTGISPVFHSPGQPPIWNVQATDWSSGKGVELHEEYDAIIVAAGAFDTPYYADTPGLQELLDSGSRLVMHAKTYPGPRPFLHSHNKIVVVGNANSANDIAAHLAPLSANGEPIYRCIRHPSNFAHLPDSRIKDVEPIANIARDADTDTLRITLVDGTVIDGVTRLIFASGYQYQFEWIQVPAVVDTDASPAGYTALSPDGHELTTASKYGAVPNLHQGTFIATAPSLAFIGLAAGSTPMPLAEIQARVVSRAFHGTLSLPLPAEGKSSTHHLLDDFRTRAAELQIQHDDPTNWRALHMVRGAEERRLTLALRETLEDAEPGAARGLFEWDERTEGIVKSMRSIKESELRRLRAVRESSVLEGRYGVDGALNGTVPGLEPGNAES